MTALKEFVNTTKQWEELKKDYFKTNTYREAMLIGIIEALLNLLEKALGL